VEEIVRAAVERAASDGWASTGTTAPAHGLIAGLESWRQGGITGVIVMMEEPELFLPPQAQRYLYRLLRLVASQGNQVLYSTHSPAFLNVVRLDELVFTERRPKVGTLLLQPDPLPADEEFRAFSEFDSSRSELFLARAAVLVEGLTEKLTLPFVFEALGHDVDRERISIVECGGKGNLLLFARVSRAVGVPFIAVHDRDAPAGSSPSDAERQLNASIAEVTGDRRVELAPDFEGVAGLRGHRHKPARAWRSFKAPGGRPVPAPLAEIVERAVALARR
jgi:predicted ATP-dependent endonuclease of OLD family